MKEIFGLPKQNGKARWQHCCIIYQFTQVVARGILRINIFGLTAIMISDSEIKNPLSISFLVFSQDLIMNIAEKWNRYLLKSGA